MHILGIPKNSYSRVKNLILEILTSGREEARKKKEKAGRKSLLIHGTVQANIIYTAILNNLTTRDATCVLKTRIGQNVTFLF
jgi:hypothetical protein